MRIMSYQGLILAVTVGVAVGTFLYNFFRQPEATYSYDDNYDYVPRTPSRTGQRRRRNRSDLCSICLSKMEHCLKTLPCSHVFHTHCINVWFRQSRSCPICRQDVA